MWKFKQNFLLYEMWFSIKLFMPSYNNRLYKYIKKLRNTDSVLNYYDYSKIIIEMKNRFQYCDFHFRYADSLYYGYYQALLKYSGIKTKHTIPLLTGMEHGIRFDKGKWIYKSLNTCYICQGAKRISEISDLDKKMPIIPVGPYIHYATEYYEENIIDDIKKKLGRTLLFFPSHTCESEPDMDDRLTDIVIERYAGQFDTIMACIYWHDVDSPIVSKLKDKGVVIVSAGFRGDSLFINRLKSIIHLADYVIGNDIGTNIGFSLYMGKQFELIGKCIENKNDAVYSDNYKAFYDAFHKEDGTDFSEHQLLRQQELYNDFWGPKFLMSQKELYSLFHRVEKLLKQSKYNLNLFHSHWFEKFNSSNKLNENL